MAKKPNKPDPFVYLTESADADSIADMLATPGRADDSAALAYEIAVYMAEIANTPVSPEAYTLAIAGESPSLIAAVIQAEQAAKATGSVIVILDQYGVPARTVTPPTRRGGGGGMAGAGPRGADWTSKSGHAVKLMMATDASGATIGATMDEMKAITGWTFGQKYVDQLQRSFGVKIWTVEATARVKRTWHAALATDIPADEPAEPAEAAGHDIDAAADLMMTGE
jgi:hypothetical protein